MLFDTHCHLDVEAFDVDREDVFSRAIASQVTRYLNPAYDMTSSRRSIVMAETHPEVVSAVGIHPNDIGELDDATLLDLHGLAEHSATVAIGEIGLDYYWDKYPRVDQKNAFIRQLELAVQVKLPVIIHCRDAYEDTLDILEGYSSRISMLLHAFSGPQNIADRALSLGCYLGIGGPVTYKNSVTLRTIVSNVPLNRFVLETDSPYLAPHPQRGKRNEPAYLHHTAKRVSEILEITIEELSYLTTLNACNLFGLT